MRGSRTFFQGVRRLFEFAGQGGGGGRQRHIFDFIIYFKKKFGRGGGRSGPP